MKEGYTIFVCHHIFILSYMKYMTLVYTCYIFVFNYNVIKTLKISSCNGDTSQTNNSYRYSYCHLFIIIYRIHIYVKINLVFDEIIYQISHTFARPCNNKHDNNNNYVFKYNILCMYDVCR